MAGAYGVKECKELFDLGFQVVKSYQAASADGKVNWLDLPELMPLISKVSPAVEGAEIAVKEILELDDMDSKELFDHARLKLSEVTADEELKKKLFVYVKLGLAVAEAIAISKVS